MRKTKSLIAASAVVSATAAALLFAGSTPSAASPKVGQTGPSTATAPYLVPGAGADGKVNFTSILTVGDAVDGYKMVGIPDGLGALKGPGNKFSLFMNHELGTTVGIERAHGSKGAFVSQWEINRHTFKVEAGKDMVQSANDVYLWDAVNRVYNAATTAFARLCSGDLPALSAFWHNGVGTQDRIYMAGEETDRGRAFAWVATGANADEAWELPRLGKFAWENAVASPHGQAKTIVIPMDDADLSTSATTAFPSELAVYVGTKQNTGHPIERAGLTNGKLYGVKVSVNGSTVTEESNAFGLGSAAYVGSGRFTLVEMGDNGDVSSDTADDLRTEFIAKDILRMQRIEDGAFDPRKGKQNDFYFVTTASMTLNSRLWRLRFDDVESPTAGGTIEILVNGGDVRMLDNIGMDQLGRIIMQEDPGNVAHVAKVWLYGADNGRLVQIAQFDPELFTPGSPAFLTQDEESSGVIDAEDLLGKGWFLLDAQIHRTPLTTELVERGQLLAMYVDPSLGLSR